MKKIVFSGYKFLIKLKMDWEVLISTPLHVFRGLSAGM